MSEIRGAARKHGRVATPAPASPRREELKALAADMEREAKAQRDEADALERWADGMDGRDEWVGRAKAFKRREIARKLFDAAFKIDEYASGTEYLDTMSVNGRTLADLGVQ